MDLRWRLVTLLGALLLTLVFATAGAILYSVRGDTEVEVRASERLARVLILAGQAGRDGTPGDEIRRRLEDILAEGPIRHLSIRLDGEQLAADASRTGPLPWLAGWLAAPAAASPEQTIQIGDVRLGIAPNRDSEIQENIGDVVELCLILLLFSAMAVALTWFSAHRALSPVRELERGLDRLAHGEASAALPGFALQEFRRIALAIEHLAESLVQSRAAERALAQRLIRVQDEERRALARELHDEMGQTLTALGATATYLERNAARLPVAEIVDCGSELNRDLKTSREQLRSLLKRLNPHDLDAISLPRALRELVAGWRHRAAAIDFALHLPATLPDIGEQAALALYRVTQEALTNVVRHSGATRCDLCLDVDEDRLQLRIADNGALPAGVPAPGVGLTGMATRLSMIGGRLHLDAPAGGGLCVSAELPLPVPNDADEEAA